MALLLYTFLLLINVVPPLVQGDCPEKVKKLEDMNLLIYEYIGDRCYAIFKHFKETFDGAYEKCKEYGGNLAMPKEYITNMYLSGGLGGLTVWIGLRERPDSGHTFGWVDGSDLEYENFDYGELQSHIEHSGHKLQCVTMDITAMWQLRDCTSTHYDSNQRPYVCEWKYKRGTKTTAKTTGRTATTVKQTMTATSVTATPKQTNTTANSSTTTATPSTTTATPSTTTATPSTTTATPTTTTANSSTTTATPTTTTATPSTTTATPSTTTAKPTTTTAKPTTTTAKPTTTTTKPTTTTAKPTTTTTKPTTTTARLTTTTATPSTTTATPSTTTSTPSTTTVKPSTTTATPSTTTAKPSTTTDKPATTTVNPATTTVKSVNVTPKLVTDTIQSPCGQFEDCKLVCSSYKTEQRNGQDCLICECETIDYGDDF